MKLTNKFLKSRNFSFEVIPSEESGDVPFCYWVLDLFHENNEFADVTLISNSIDVDQEIEDKPKEILKHRDLIWTITLFEGRYGFCETEEELDILIKALKKLEPKENE